MDDTEDLSARVLLKRILTTEPPRTPVVRAAARGSTGATRRSSRLENKNAEALTPHAMLRRSLRQKMHEGRKSLPPPKKKRSTSMVLKRTPGQAPLQFTDEDTPRHILMNILRTDPVRTPVAHEEAASEEPQPSSANSSITGRQHSIGLSELDLPDLTIGNAVSTAKGLSRKRPHRSLNITAFEKRLRDGEGAEEQKEESLHDNSSVSLSSSTSLSLKTPFVDAHTEKRGLQRRVSNRRRVTEEEFGAAVNKRHMGGATSILRPEQGPSDTAYSEGFTLGLSKISEPDITSDIFNCNTALYAQPDAVTSNFSITATQDKPTVMASQLQRKLSEMEQEEQNELRKESSLYTFPHEEGEEAEPQEEECFSESQEKERRSTVETPSEDAAAILKLEENERTAASQSGLRHDSAGSEEENEMVAHTEEEKVSHSQSEDDEDGGVDSEPEEDVVTGSQSVEEEVQQDTQTEEEEEDEQSVVDSQAEEEKDAIDSQTEEEQGAVESQTEEEEEQSAVESQTEEEEEQDAVDSQTEKEEEQDAVDSHPEEAGDGAEDEQSEELMEEDGVEQSSAHLEHISKRTHRSEYGLIVPVAEGDLTTETRFSDHKPKANTTFDLPNSLDFGTEVEAEMEPDADKENSFHLPELRQSFSDDGHQSEESPEEAGAQGEEWEEEEEEEVDNGGNNDDEEEEEEETEEIPSKTPAFVRQKRNLLCPDPLASPSVLRNTQPRSGSDESGLATTKPKQVRKNRTRTAREKGGLPKSYLMGIFKHFAKTKVSADVYPVLQEIMDKFFQRMAEDLETYALHAKRKTIEFDDVELLLRRQGHVNDKVPVEVLIEKYLRMDQRRLLIPMATEKMRKRR